MSETTRGTFPLRQALVALVVLGGLASGGVQVFGQDPPASRPTDGHIIFDRRIEDRWSIRARLYDGGETMVAGSVASPMECELLLFDAISGERVSLLVVHQFALPQDGLGPFEISILDATADERGNWVAVMRCSEQTRIYAGTAGQRPESRNAEEGGHAKDQVDPRLSFFFESRSGGLIPGTAKSARITKIGDAMSFLVHVEFSGRDAARDYLCAFARDLPVRWWEPVHGTDKAENG